MKRFLSSCSVFDNAKRPHIDTILSISILFARQKYPETVQGEKSLLQKPARKQQLVYIAIDLFSRYGFLGEDDPQKVFFRTNERIAAIP
ncbi:MAG: hypothetical protein A2306_09725 [Omnitrophica WOR_2 bacterium RIFOXYB2_FULL_38_16]|nr:MAG: hypothetical protein A2243_02100 [Omnitrophica WOR_2 bacterium RIFOXYA2_FULL_38_17]OGX54495.1 MAG: hypothetical protein A2267_06675 [Omnitrophica WOR_2 bacterium RIFOXYA12_FULL_38_10]OGX55407.1 MAG: hypothetical protein A2447_11625 [Omnitrophica WOR_2 bacterium RIFOXYC2_FULL_38_12]OGX59513.1 MAG: hypothetical protein A2306_09725 [Omnitrophica WOR_2 bacterium RIFOXYB2_FULL_38_16]